MSFYITIITPHKIIYSSIADEVILPGLTSKINILENHADLITVVNIGLLRIKLNKIWKFFVLYGGIAKIKKNQMKIIVYGLENEKILRKIELSKAKKKLTLINKNIKSNKEKLDASIEYKKILARLEGIRYLL